MKMGIWNLLQPEVQVRCPKNFKGAAPHPQIPAFSVFEGDFRQVPAPLGKEWSDRIPDFSDQTPNFGKSNFSGGWGEGLGSLRV